MSTTPILLELLAKSVVLLLGASLSALIMRRASAARRHLIWAGAFVALLALPFTKLVAPRWLLPLHQPAARIAATHGTLIIPEENVQAGPVIATTRPLTHLPDWRLAMFWLWLAGSVTLLGYRLLGSLQLARLKWRSVPITDPDISAMTQKVAREFAVKRNVEIRVTAEMRVPMTWGVWKSILMLPPDIGSWGEERLTAALRHEFGHIARRDSLVRLVAQIATALYWPNPLVWFAARSLQMAQEQACDDLVLRAGTPADDYASLLFDAMRKWSAGGFATRHAIAMARPCTLEKRVCAIVNETRDRRPAALKTKLSASLVLAGVLALCAVAQISPGQDAATPAPSSLPDDWPPAREGLVTVEYAVPSKLITPVDDGFLGPDGKTYATPVKLLESNGIEFPAGTSAAYLKKNGKLIVRNTIESQNAIGKFYNLPAIPHPVAKTKLPDAIIPKVSLKDATVGECVEYFQKLSVELDTKQADPKLKGVNMVMKLTPGINIADKKITLELANVPYREAFKKFTDAAGLDAFSQPYAIILVPSIERDDYNPQGGMKTLELHKDGSMAMNGVPVPGLQELAGKLQEIREKNPDLSITIFADSGTSTKQLADVVDALKKAGIKRVGVQTQSADGAKPANQNPAPTVDISSDGTGFEKGIVVAKGNAVLKFGVILIQAELIKYDPATKTVEATGHVSILKHDAQNDTKMTGDEFFFNLDTQELRSNGNSHEEVRSH